MDDDLSGWSNIERIENYSEGGEEEELAKIKKKEIMKRIEI